MLASKLGLASSGNRNNLIRDITGHDLEQAASQAAARVNPAAEDQASVEIDGTLYSRAALLSLNNAALKRHCAELGLRSNGSKEDLVTRLLKKGRAQKEPAEYYWEGLR
mmetsp:Transcript_18949/g.48188  ORF Transcript_18949/g.48188 Transcript_18949/m.48188 type:complete len:109 (+) Transcript_18949:228-554(+)